VRARRARPLCAAAAGLLLAALPAGAARQTAPTAGVAHPERWPRAHSVGLDDAATEAFVTALMARMSVAEKVGQIIQADLDSITPEDLRDYPLGALVAGGNSAPLGGDLRDAGAQRWLASARALHAMSMQARAGHTAIPILFGIDAVHGNDKVRGATIFPHNIGLGAAHDPELIRRIGEATAQESSVVGVDWVFAPTVAVPQDLRWGRSYEAYSQDPALVRSYAAQMVLGLQGDPGVGQVVQRGHVAAAAKHFLGDGATTHGIDQGDSEIDEQQLAGTHAQGYVSAIEAGVMTVMVSYSSWQQRKMHGNQSLLTAVLKQRMGFDGFVVSDWNGYAQLPGCSSTDCPGALAAGVDMYMAAGGWKALFANLLAQAQSGTLSPQRLDDAVHRILRVKVKLGLFDAQRPWEGQLQQLGSGEHRALARQAVRESLVLLKNRRRLLPIRATARVLVAGSGADDIARQCGGWTLSWQGDDNRNSDFPQAESIYQAVSSALAAGGGSAQLSVQGHYTIRPDVAIVVFGERPYAEFAGDLQSLDYHAAHPQDLALLRRLRAAHIPVVSVFLSGRPLLVNRELAASDAFVAAWLPGSEGGGVADLLIGDAAGAQRHEFRGTLSFAWPAAARRTLFALGYGLHTGAGAAAIDAAAVDAAAGAAAAGAAAP
jgi:beta-glucosidase